jgi:hypothetical protein
VRRAVLLVLFVLVTARADAQHDSASTLGIAAASLIPAAGITAIIIGNQQAFWRYATEVPFHISNDPPYSMHIDKFSHMYMSAGGSDGMRASYRLAGLSNTTSSWLGAGLTLLCGTAIELEDARHGNDPQYGFSPGDFAADIIGASLPVLKNYYPTLERLDVKLSMWPSAAYKSGQYKTISDDYESQYYWLSMDLHDWTPLPRWLNVALGFGCENLYRNAYANPSADGQPYTDLYIAPDINLKGLPIEGKTWRTIADILSYVRIPFPTLQVYPRFKVWGLR